MRRFRQVAALVGLTLATTAHVGSPDAWFAGRAGPYQVTVHIEAPDVIPGIAVINVRAEGVADRVTAFVNTHDAEGATPPPDELLPVADQPGWRRARLWVMNAGSNRVTVEVLGAQGAGSLVVPLAAVAQRRLAITPSFVLMVVGGGVVLVAGMLTFVGAAVREGVLEPGALPDEKRRRKARMSMVRATVAITVVLGGTTWWWRAEDDAFRRRLYRPLDVSTRIDTTSGTPLFTLSITDTTWRPRDEVAVLRARGELPETGLIDDHGKVMHVFLFSEDGRAMAHLHPETKDTVTFTSVMPTLPPGPYRVFADIVQASGFTQTLTSHVTVGTLTSQVIPSLADPDDSWAVAGDSGNTVRLVDGTQVTWLRWDTATLHAGDEAGLRFVVQPLHGDTSQLEPYLGMPGHAAVVRDDGQVFIHLHPMGTISPAAQARLSPPSSHVMHPVVATDTLRFPYAFPQPGRYTIWVQVKRRGKVLSAPFAVDVR